MSDTIPVESALQILRSAFSPLRCVAEEWDYGAHVRFRIFDEDDPLLSNEGLLAGDVSNVRLLNSMIQHARETLTERGFELDAWEFPRG